MRQNVKAYGILTLIIGLLCLYFYRDTITLFPSFIHAWTQSDRYALALAFLDNGMILYKTQTFNLMTVDGITGVDLPWHEYIIAWIMKLSGSEAPSIFRTYTLLYSCLGYFFLFKLSKLFGNNTFKSLLIVVFTFTLPVLVYYQAGFVPSAPALATMLIGLYYYYGFEQSGNYRKFYLAIALLTLAALYRSPFNIVLFAVVLQQALASFQQKKFLSRQTLSFVIAYTLIIGYHYYKTHLNSMYGSMFLTSLMPANGFSEFWDTLKEVKQRWQWEYFTLGHYLLMLLASVSLAFHLIRRKSCDKTLTILSQQVILLLAGGLFYFILMNQQYPAHDYYFIDSLYPGFIFLFLIGITVYPSSKSWQYPMLIVLGLPLLGISVLQSKAVQIERYTFHFWDRGEITRQNFEGSAEFLDELQIPSTSKVLVLDAYSTNAPLILMDRRGYTVQNTTKENLMLGLARPFDYVVVQDVFLPSDVIFNYPELTHKLERIGGNGKISVFKYVDEELDQNIYSLLGITKGYKTFPLDFSITKSEKSPWEYEIETLEVDSGQSSIGLMKSDDLFGPVFVLNQNPSKGKMLFQSDFLHESPEVRFEIVATVMQGDQQLFYRSFPVHLRKTQGWQSYFCLFDLPEALSSDMQLKCTIYNPNGVEVEMQNLEVILY